MRSTVKLAVLAALISTPAMAQGLLPPLLPPLLSSPVAMPAQQPSPVYAPPQQVYVPAPPPPSSTIYTRSGNATFGSDGSTIIHSGNETFINGPNGQSHVCTTSGAQTFCN